ncbi:MAG TPA: thiamine pyrophosphate-requiring protein, partial [Gammaproteobacteria bacterium]|nr:thiamine pyrophosphate-requiring protein [Gammaproteobacteria bacterium]
YEASQDVPDFPYAEYAKLLGLEGIAVTETDQIGPAWDRALSAAKPTVLEVSTDPDVPPLPPHITKEQAKAYLSAMLHGDPDALGIVKASVKQFAADFSTHFKS